MSQRIHIQSFTRPFTRREVIVGAGGCLLSRGIGWKALADPADDLATMDLIADPHFRQGVNMWSPVDAPISARTRAGILCSTPGSCKPIWDGAQWYSHFDIGKAAPQTMPSGAIRYFDGAKSFTFGPPGSPESDLIFSLNARKEFNDTPPTTPGTWPHLLVEQNFTVKPKLTSFHRVPFRIRYRLLRSEPHKGSGWNDARDTAQFLFYVTLQDANKNSPGFHDYFWFGVPIYDARYEFPRKYTMADIGNSRKHGTNKFIFNPPGELYTHVPAASGKWITIEKNLLPLMNEALETAWAAGFLTQSREKSNFVLGGMNMGWEIVGPIDAAMQVQDLSLQVVCCNSALASGGIEVR